VAFRALAATAVTFVSTAQLTAVAPAQAAGVDNVFVTTAGGTSAVVAGDHYTYVVPPATPSVTGISPATGSTAGGNAVTIIGTGFSGATGVTFRALAASSFTVVSATEITAVVPAQAAGVDNVFITAPGGTSAAVAGDHYTYVAPPAKPTISGLAPASGTAAGGNTVIITGTGFTGASGPAGVVFRALDATSYVVNSDTQITAVVPAQAAGVDNVFVTTPGGTSSAVTADHYTYTASA
jgi:hypothetical protein